MQGLRLLINVAGCMAVVAVCVLLHGALNYLALAFFLIAIPAATSRMIEPNVAIAVSIQTLFAHRINYWATVVGAIALAIAVASGAGDRFGETALLIWPAAGFILVVHAFVALRLPADLN